MTTIATDGVTVASDSMRACGQEIVDLSTQKIKVRDGHLFAFTGDFAFFDPAIEWFLGGRDIEKAPKVHKDGNWRLLVLYHDRIESYTDTQPYGDPFPYPQAFGSGADYAFTALHLGKSPEEAVALSSRFNVYTGGPIQVVNIADCEACQGVR
jgi:hypothetical protein